MFPQEIQWEQVTRKRGNKDSNNSKSDILEVYDFEKLHTGHRSQLLRD